MKTCRNIESNLLECLSKQKIFQIIVVERKETHVLCGVHFSPCLTVYEKIKQKKKRDYARIITREFPPELVAVIIFPLGGKNIYISVNLRIFFR